MKKVSVMMIATLAAALFGAAPAYAAPAHTAPTHAAHSSSVVITAQQNTTLTPQASGAASAAGASIVCTLQIQYPHKSTHVPGTINDVATWSCSQTVVELDIEIYLYLNDIFVSDGSDSAEVTSSMQANVYTGCTTGSYRGIAIGHVMFPAGYEPNSQTTDVYSSSVYISCP